MTTGTVPPLSPEEEADIRRFLEVPGPGWADPHSAVLLSYLRQTFATLDAARTPRETPDPTTLFLEGTERADGYDPAQQLSRRIDKWLDELALHGALTPDERRLIRLTVGESPRETPDLRGRLIYEVGLLEGGQIDERTVAAIDRALGEPR